MDWNSSLLVPVYSFMGRHHCASPRWCKLDDPPSSRSQKVKTEGFFPFVWKRQHVTRHIWSSMQSTWLQERANWRSIIIQVYIAATPQVSNNIFPSFIKCNHYLTPHTGANRVRFAFYSLLYPLLPQISDILLYIAIEVSTLIITWVSWQKLISIFQVDCHLRVKYILYQCINTC